MINILKIFINKSSYWALLFILSQIHICLSEDKIEESLLKNNIVNKCLDDRNKEDLNIAWDSFFPYGYEIVRSNDRKLVGLDIAIINHLARKTGYQIKFDNILWQNQNNNIKEGLNDIALGATYNDQRGEDAYFSLPYRYEENAIFVSKNNNLILDFDNINELLTQIRTQNFKLGIINKQIYGDNLIDEFINSKNNSDIVKSYTDIIESINALNSGEIDGFISERVSCAYILRNNPHNIEEIVIKKKVPVHIMFSRKTVSVNIVRDFNKEIKNFIGTSEYKSMIKNYLYSSLLMQIMSTRWFYIISIIGTIGFTISGCVHAFRENMPIFRTFLVAIIPSIFGMTLKDLVIGSQEDGYNFCTCYILISLIIIFIFYIKIWVLRFFNKDNENMPKFIPCYMSNLLIIGDAIGQSCFFVIGIAISMVLQINPIIMIPIIAIIVSHLGVAIRNIMISGKSEFSDELGIEVTLVWSFILISYFYYHSLQLNFNKVEFIMIISILGCFFTKLLAHYLKIPNIKFVCNNKKNA